MRRIKSFAKINLGLEIIRKREDEYHDIRTIFQAIDFYDVLEFRTIREKKVLLDGKNQSVSWDENNLIFKAATLLKERFNLSQGIEIWVDKNIPPGKGLGGGSSNAAMTLYALNIIWELHLEKKDLMNLGSKLGADVPFFLEGGLCLGLGRGDEVTPLHDLNSLPCILVLPSFSISTASVYDRFPLSLTSDDKESKIIKFLEHREFDLLENNLEETIFSIYPQLKAIKSLFRSQGSELSLVSGTGSAVFGLFLEKERAERILKELKKSYEALIVETLSRKRYWKNLNVGV